MGSIMRNFPRHLKPRDVQTNTLKALENEWDSANIFVVNLPTASGKSSISLTLLNWQKRAIVVTPTKLLVNQYKAEYPRLQVLRGKKDYYCSKFDCSLDKRPTYNKRKLCTSFDNCKGCKDYLMDLKKSRVMPFLLANYYIYIAHKLYRPLLVVDEAHTLIDMIKNMNSKKFWQFKYRFPSNLNNREQIKNWINRLPKSAFTYSYSKNEVNRKDDDQLNLRWLKDELNNNRPTYVITLTTETYRGSDDEVLIKAVPVDVSKCPAILWPDGTVKKVVLMSATISRKDIEQLGLSERKIKYIEASSPIAAERRPVIIPSEASNMSYKYQAENLPKLAMFLQKKIREHDGEKGLVHITYSLATRLKEYINNNIPELNDKLIYHDKFNKTKQYNYFRDTDEPKILIASGMYEGIDLPYDAGRWQIIAKVPWPSLADPAIKFLAGQDKEYYAWETIKVFLQACGRISRTLDDYGCTYCFDSSFTRLYNQNQELFPTWFKEGVKYV